MTIDADTLTRWIDELDSIDRAVTDMMLTKPYPGDGERVEAEHDISVLDYQAQVDALRESIQQARLDALRAEVV